MQKNQIWNRHKTLHTSGKVLVRQVNCHANSRQNGKIKRICNGTKGKYCVSKAISASSRYKCMYRDNSKCKTLYETNTAAFVTLVETSIQRFGCSDPKVSTSVRPLQLVVTGSQHSKGQIIVSRPYKQSDCHGCIKSRMGWQFGPSDCTGHLVNSRETIAYKLSGDGGSYLDHPKLSSIVGESVCPDQERQFDSCTIHKSPGGSPQLCYKAWELWQMAIENNMFLKGAHIAGKINILPDQLSRIVIRPAEWTLNDSVLQKIFQIWKKPMIDLFASYHKKKMDIFCTWDQHPQALTVDAFSISWNQMFAYAFPPICLIPKVLQHMRLGHCQMILIAPQWPRRHWYPDLLKLCIANPIKLPLSHDLLRQPNTIIYHPDPKVFSLNAWLLSTDNLQQKVFRRGLETYCQPHGGQVHRRTTLVNSNSLIAGVVENKLIHIQHL